MQEKAANSRHYAEHKADQNRTEHISSTGGMGSIICCGKPSA